MLFQGPNLLPEQEPHRLQDSDLRKREGYLRRCKEAMWSRWTKEYLRALRERHNIKHPGTKLQLAVGDVVIIESPLEKSRGKWPLGYRSNFDRSSGWRDTSGEATGRKGLLRKTSTAPLPAGVILWRNQDDHTNYLERRRPCFPTKEDSSNRSERKTENPWDWRELLNCTLIVSSMSIEHLNLAVFSFLVLLVRGSFL